MENLIYRGIIPYDEDSNYKFAGRQEETLLLYKRIVRNDYTVYYAASGEGKSSLIRAGLLPILKRRDYFPVYIVFKDEEFKNVENIESVLFSRIDEELKKDNVVWGISERSNYDELDDSQKEFLEKEAWWKLRNYSFKRGDTELTPLFIFDQFEEVFTKASYDWTDSFFGWLERITTDYVPDSLTMEMEKWDKDIVLATQKNFKALFSFRTEYLGDLEYWCVQKHFLPALQENRMCLKPITPQGAREIIRLNEDVLGIYADKIMQGCAEKQADIVNKDRPCVYALILSVVCQTLSEMPDKERKGLLEELGKEQEQAINKTLLGFYKKKLKEAELDYAKDEKIIEAIENALVDENGKRRRRDTDETSMVSLKRWMDELSRKEIGLIKIMGKRNKEREDICTVEFPHDRLCKAIDAARKERQRKIVWKLKRQGEWMQFGGISVVIGIIVFLWNMMMSTIKPVIGCIIHTFEEGETKINGFYKVLDTLWSDYMHGKPSVLLERSLDEGFSTILLMIMLIVFMPLMVIFIARKSKNGQIASLVISSVCSIGFVLLAFRNDNIVFGDDYVPVFTYLGLIVSICILFCSWRRFKSLNKLGVTHSSNGQLSLWPLWGGYFLFATYLFYEFLRRTTFGINEPCDSAWAIVALPMLYSLWAWGFFNMKSNRDRPCMSLVPIGIGLLALGIVFGIAQFIPFYNPLRQSYGMPVSLFFIAIAIGVSCFVFWGTKSSSQYYALSKGKRIVVMASASCVLLLSFFLNLGYNPIKINPSSVFKVNSWRTVWVQNSDSIGVQKLGVRYATKGDTIVPCCIEIESLDSCLSKGDFFIPIKKKLDYRLDWRNIDFYEFKYNVTDSIMTGKILVYPLLEEYFKEIISNNLKSKPSRKDSINYYAAKLFTELRNSEIAYLQFGTSCNADSIKSLPILRELQQQSLNTKLSELSIDTMDTTIMSNSNVRAQELMYILEDEHLADFQCELIRSLLLCFLTDYVSLKYMPAIFTISTYYIPAFFFNAVLSMDLRYSLGYSSNSDILMKKNKGYSGIRMEYLRKRRLFAWYAIFNTVCLMNIGDINSYCNSYLNSISDTDEKSDFKDVIEVKIEQIDDMIDKISETDRLFIQIKDSVLNCLSPILDKYSSGIYNNFFYNVCENLIIESKSRGNDIKKDTILLSKYPFYRSKGSEVIFEYCGNKNWKEKLKQINLTNRLKYMQNYNNNE